MAGLLETLADAAWRGERRLRLRQVTLIAAMPVLGLTLTGLVAPAITIAMAGLVGWYLSAGKPPSAAVVADRLDRRHPELEDSTRLLLSSPESLPSPLARRQQVRVRGRLEQLAGKFPGRALLGEPEPGAFLRHGPWVGAVLTVAVLLFATLRPLDVNVMVRVTPPAYTGLGISEAPLGDLTVPEGSRIRWLTTGLPEGARLRFEGLEDGSRTIPADFELAAADDLLYSLSWDTGSAAGTTPPATIRVVRDAAPRLLLVSPAVSPQEFDTPPPAGLALAVDVRDDYGVATVGLLLTVAKGLGEGVKFRERRVPLSLPAAGDERRLTLTAALDPAELGMEPGDELYAQFEAHDRRGTDAGRGLSQTLVFRWAGDDAGVSALAGLPVDRMPDYFRSQRQIIIDTERLLANEAELERAAFIDRSELLGAEQRTLRLRYGQYLGEEDESGGSPMAPPQAAAADASEAEAADDHSGHDHGSVGATTGDAGDGSAMGDASAILETFGHSHDYAEQATLFDPETRGTLKAALNAMWQSELQLGLRAPAAALPYQYEALRNLKAVQQASRIYVKRVGFEPPPLSEERRATGELDEVIAEPVPAPPPPVADEAAGFLTGLLADRDGFPRELIEAVRASGEAPIEERSAAARWIADPACEDCRGLLVASLLRRVPRPVPPARTQEVPGSRAAAGAYLDRIGAPR